MADLLVMLPTRKRPHNLARFIKAFRETVHEADLVAIVDDDDPTHETVAVPGAWDGLNAERLVLPRAPLVPKLNQAARIYRNRYRALLFLADDNVPVTPGWDKQMMAALEDMGGTGMVYANDLIRGEALPCSVLMSTDIVKALGWFACPLMSHYYIDNVWRDFGQGAGCLRYLPNVVIKHLHPAFGRAANDALYSETRERYWDGDERAYATWRAERMEADIKTVKGLLTC